MLLLCSAATARPKAMRSKTKTRTRTSFDAIVVSGECSVEISIELRRGEEKKTTTLLSVLTLYL